METLSTVSKEEKNKLNSDSAFLIALDITIPDVAEVIKIINNNENVTWNGVTYQAFPFELEEFSEATTGDIPEFNLKVGNANNIIGNYIRQYDAYVKNNGFEPIEVKISVVNTKNLEDNPADAISEIDHLTTLTKPMITYETVTFTLGGVNAFNKTVHTRMLRNACRFKFKGVKCGYSGSETTCNKTFARCQELSNQARYGGFPLIGNKGVLS